MIRFALLVVLLAGCPGPHEPRPTHDPTVDEVTARLAKARAEATSFVADANMDYWIGDQRTKGEVLVMGELGAKVRLAGLSPAGGSTMAEMACDGTNFVYVDYQKNCTLSGPCNGQSIAQFFHIELEPDDFVHLALGTPPVLDGATGTVKWDADKGVERVELHAGGQTQKLAIDTRGDHWDVVDSELVGADGKQRWKVTNSDFVTVDGHRVPGKSRFVSPGQTAQDLLVDWGAVDSRKVGAELPAAKFQLAAPAGLPHC